MTAGRRDGAGSDIGEWFRRQGVLDSRTASLSVHDADFWFHKYRTFRKREIQFLMMVEVKTRSREPDNSQSDTMALVDYILRTPQCSNGSSHYENIPALVGGPWDARKACKIRRCGAHLLQLSGTDPDNSAIIRWDGKPITVENLLDVLRFAVSPDTFKKIDLRPHHVQDVLSGSESKRLVGQRCFNDAIRKNADNA